MQRQPHTTFHVQTNAQPAPKWGEKTKKADLSKIPSFPFLLLSMMLYGTDLVSLGHLPGCVYFQPVAQPPLYALRRQRVKQRRS